MRLVESLNAWPSSIFNETLVRELKSQPNGSLPLQQAVKQGGYALDTPAELMLIATHHTDDVVVARVGVFFESIIAGCNCADDPSPIEPIREYCEMNIEIDRATGFARVDLVGE